MGGQSDASKSHTHTPLPSALSHSPGRGLSLQPLPDSDGDTEAQGMGRTCQVPRGATAAGQVLNGRPRSGLLLYAEPWGREHKGLTLTPPHSLATLLPGPVTWRQGCHIPCSSEPTGPGLAWSLAWCHSRTASILQPRDTLTRRSHLPPWAGGPCPALVACDHAHGLQLQSGKAGFPTGLDHWDLLRAASRPPRTMCSPDSLDIPTRVIKP